LNLRSASEEFYPFTQNFLHSRSLLIFSILPAITYTKCCAPFLFSFIFQLGLKSTLTGFLHHCLLSLKYIGRERFCCQPDSNLVIFCQIFLVCSSFFKWGTTACVWCVSRRECTIHLLATVFTFFHILILFLWPSPFPLLCLYQKLPQYLLIRGKNLLQEVVGHFSL